MCLNIYWELWEESARKRHVAGEFILQHRPPGSETSDTKDVVEAEVLCCAGTKSGPLDLLSLAQEEWCPG